MLDGESFLWRAEATCCVWGRRLTLDRGEGLQIVKDEAAVLQLLEVLCYLVHHLCRLAAGGVEFAQAVANGFPLQIFVCTWSLCMEFLIEAQSTVRNIGISAWSVFLGNGDQLRNAHQLPMHVPTCVVCIEGSCLGFSKCLIARIRQSIWPGATDVDGDRGVGDADRGVGVEDL